MAGLILDLVALQVRVPGDPLQPTCIRKWCPRTVLVLSPSELFARLSRLLPPPRIHRQRYHRVLAPHARLRAAVVAIGREATG